MKRIIIKIARNTVIISAALILVAVGINAGDNRGNIRESFMGRLITGGDEKDCPEGMALVDSPKGLFCMDIYEASAGEKCPVNSPRNNAETQVDLNERECFPVSVKNARPWTYISQTQAIEACAKAGKRLATNEEWYYAALGTPGTQGGANPDDCQISSNWDDQPGGTGSGANCVSSSGVYDMIGNVWEWVSGTADNGRYEGRDLPAQGYVLGVDEAGLAVTTGENQEGSLDNDYFWIKKSGIRSIARGGYWDNEDRAGKYAAYLVSETSFNGTAVGFRCASSIRK